MAIRVVTEPAVEPISVDDLKVDLRIDSDLTAEDYLLVALITAARRWCEGVLRRTMITTTLELILDAFPGGDTIELPRPPLVSVTSVKYYDEAETEATLSAANYQVDTYSQPGRIVLTATGAWPSTALRPANGVIIRYVAGYGAEESSVPATFVQAIRLLAGHWYESREAVASTGAVPKEIPFGVEALLMVDRNF